MLDRDYLREINDKIANRLKYYRVMNGLSQRDLAKLLSVTQTVIYKYETGRYKIPSNILFYISYLFKIPVEDMYRDIEIEFAEGLCVRTRKCAELCSALSNEKKDAVIQLLRCMQDD